MAAEPRTDDPAKRVERTYLALTLISTLASSFIWGINTIFLLDAGLSNAEAFAANAFFTAGMVLFEIPTGIVADTRGRQLSFVLGTATLLVSTLLYLWMWQIHAPLWGWAIASILLGLGFTFFSGATEAWLVDALAATGFTGHLEHVFGRAQTATGAAMLIGTVAGGAIAQVTNLGVPYILRAVMLGVTMIVALVYMRDIGFTPRRDIGPVQAVRNVVRGSIDSGFRNPPVRWLMLAIPFTAGTGIYLFYAAQPYLLELYGDPTAYSIAGLAAAIFAGVQIAGGLMVPVDPSPLPTPDRCDPRRLDHQHRLPGGAGPAADVHRRAPAAGGVIVRGRRHPADAAGLPERSHSVGATGDRAVVRLADGIGRRGGGTADPGPGGRRQRLRRLLHGGGRDPGRGAAVRAAGAA